MSAYTEDEHGRLIKQMLPQLLIAMIKKAGGSYQISVQEVDATSQDMLAFRIDERGTFIFEVQKKQ